MKVLSVKEPYATFIKLGMKKVETRSFKTSYRGELYIHASATQISKRDQKKWAKFVKNTSFQYGKILCKCKLVDCIYMTKEYVDHMKKQNHQEYLCGEYKEGRYAWILKDVVPLENPIQAKGQLNIWNYYSEFEIMDFMNDIEYGYVDQKKQIHQKIDDKFSEQYILQSPKEVIQNKIGVCWDQVELERYYFKNNDWNVKTYFIVYYDQDMCPTHTFLTFEKDGSYYWFEHAWEKYRGIHKYSSKRSLLEDIKKKFLKDLETFDTIENVVLLEYSKPPYGMRTNDFYHYCEQGIRINI